MRINYLLTLIVTLLLVGSFSPRFVAQDTPKQEKCAVHGETLKKDRVPIYYGLYWPQKGYLEAKQKEFPNAFSSVEGGCASTDESPKYADVLYCQKCREAEALWLKEHPVKRVDNLQEFVPKSRKLNKGKNKNVNGS